MPPHFITCPRCNQCSVYPGHESLSRTCRDGGAAIYVCELCAGAEAFSTRDVSEWPLPSEELLAEAQLDTARYLASLEEAE
jgi:hypothetical protein